MSNPAKAAKERERRAYYRFVKNKENMAAQENKLKIVCVYCNAEWTAEMNLGYASASDGCDTCGHGASVSVEVIITCANCGRVVYKKEMSNDR